VNESDRAGVVLVDDHASVVQSVAAGLASVLDVPVTPIGPEALTSVDDVLGRIEELAPQLALIDLHLGALGSALPLFPRVVALGTQVVVFTASEDPVTLARALEAGASGLLQKSTGFEAVVERVRDALDGRTLIHDGERLDLAAALRRHRRDEDERLAPFASLTQREGTILQALVDGLTVEQIADRELVSIHTVRTQVKAVLRKVGVSSQVAAVALVHRTGWSART
jgi:two-component system, NarL family, nitrate/nitrite response regulator NarL